MYNNHFNLLTRILNINKERFIIPPALLNWQCRIRGNFDEVLEIVDSLKILFLLTFYHNLFFIISLTQS